MITPAFWKAKKVLVTGHTGFKGAWCCHWLLALGAQVSGISLPPAGERNLYTDSRLSDHLSHDYFIDITHRDALQQALETISPDYVMHLAAQPLVIESYHNPYDTYMTNVMGTFNLLEKLENLPSVKAVLVITSDKCYTPQAIPLTEEHPLGGEDPYSASKACAELVTHVFKRPYESKGIRLATARAGNVIGGGDWGMYRLVPDIIKALLDKKILDIRHPFSIRPWQYILDVLSGYFMLVESMVKDNNSGAWNFGPIDSEVWTVKNIVDFIQLDTSLSLQVNYGSTSSLHENPHLRLDCQKSVQKLHWKPRYSLESFFKETLDFYKQYDRVPVSKLVETTLQKAMRLYTKETL